MKRWSIFGGAMLSFVYLAGCGGGSGGESDGEGGGEGGEGEAEEVEVIGEESEDATELTFWTFNEQHIGIYEDAVNRWNEEHEDRPIKLQAEVYPIEQMNNNLLLSLQSGSGAPDMADIEISYFANFLEGDVQLESMNEHVEPVLDDMVEERFDIYSKDDNYYGMPYHVGATVMYYNTEIMEEAGVDIDEIVTWDDYVEAGEQVVENTDSMMTTVEVDEHFSFWPLISQRGSDYFNDEGDLTLANDTNVDTLQFLDDMVNEHEVAEVTPGGFHHSEEYYGYMNDGGAASLMMPTWYMGRFIDYMPDLEGKMEIRPLPVWEEGGNRTAGMGGTGTVVTNQTEEPELAKEFLAYAKLSEEGNIALWQELGFDPPMYTVWDDEAMDEPNPYYEYFDDDIFDTLLDLNGEIEALNLTPDLPDVQSEIHTNVLNSAIRQQSQDPEEALKQAEDAVSSGQTEE
ncbi:ABC transporter substrate-binding protein [Marinococcus luteus]|uniref:ABC transporter substrate-binding protein n=1 Tax=Marinococcus luteus TaxID=1122204 RepID=UPI002ACD1100|nr:ABC transporter substrate-binding protein [Marinococcus luteus]MDZ5783086.1 ABC transporter substrate-binding protein [Marinococcus luteus]